MKKKIKKYITMLVAAIMCSSMILTNVQAVGIYEGEDTTSVSGTEEPSQNDSSKESSGDEGQSTDDSLTVKPELNNGTNQAEGVNQEVGSADVNKEFAIPELSDIAAGKSSLQSMNIEKAAANAVVPAEGIVRLDIGSRAITLFDGKYKFGNQEGVNGTNEYTIFGNSTLNNNIVVESGVSAVVHLEPGTKIDLSAGTDELPGIHVKTGASLTLILEEAVPVQPEVLVKGSKLASGICVESGANVTVSGKGKLKAIGGGGAAGIGANQNQGGTFGTASADVQVTAFSNQNDKAININRVTGNTRMLKGTLSGVAATEDKVIYIENRDNRENDKYTVDLPVGYSSFATTTASAGGEYVSYFSTTGKVENAKLLANASSKNHVFDLVYTNMASLTDLQETVIQYTVMFDANGGRFPNQAYTMKAEVGYGMVIPPDKVPGTPNRVNHEALEWYLDKDMWAQKWEVETKEVVKGTTLYMKWKPIKCKVTFKQGGVKDDIVEDNHAYGDVLNEPQDPSGSNQVLDGWYNISIKPEKMWQFGAGGDTVTLENTVLEARFLKKLSVEYVVNASGDSSAKNIASPITTGIEKRTIARPSDQPTRDDYSFICWSTTATGAIKRWDFTTDVLTGNLKLYARWAKSVTAVNFTPGTGASMIGENPQYVTFDERIIEPEASMTPRGGTKPTEYVLNGWWYTENRVETQWDFDDHLIDEDGVFNLSAKWRQKNCWITIDPGADDAVKKDGAELDFPIPYGTRLKADELTANYLEKEGHYISGWESNKKPWNPDVDITADTTLKALWSPELYTVNFIVDTDNGMPPIKNNTAKVYYNQMVASPSYPTEEWKGHQFEGWYTGEDGTGEKWVFSGTGANVVKKNMDLYAKWSLIDYYITYNFNDNGATDADKTGPYHYGDKLSDTMTELPQPTRSNYSFEGWYTDAACTDGNEFSLDAEITGDVQLYAKWIGDPRELTLSIQAEGTPEGGTGEVVEHGPIDVRYGDKLIREDLEKAAKLEARPGYTLNGWYTDAEKTEENKWDFESDTITDNLTLYSYWTRDIYTIHFETFEGDTVNNIEDVESYYGYTIGEPEKPVREHYTFGGWYADADRTEENKWDFANKITGSMTLYAKWIPNIYTLTFETNEGTKLEPLEVTYGTYPDPADMNTKKEGYVVEGWYRDVDLTLPFKPQEELVTENMKLFVNWEREKYTVKFHYLESKGSSNEEVVKDENIYHSGDTIVEPVKVVEHQTLSKWYQDKGMQERWVFKRDKIKKSMDLYAYWSDTQYNVHFETFDGTEIEDTKSTWGEFVAAPPDPERTGYTFKGWFKDAGQKEAWDFEEDYVDGDTTIYSGWTANMYTVTFDVNGGEGQIGKQTVPFGSMIAQPETPTRSGYKFTGWKVTGKAKAAEGATWNFGSDTVDGDMTLTAQWTESANADNGNAGGNTGGNNTSGNGTTAGSGGAAGSGTGSNTSAASQALKDAASGLAEILTGDKAPLTYSIAGTIVGVFMLAWALIRKFK